MDFEETYSIHIEGRWSLEDLYIFPRAYEQVYFLIHSLQEELDEAAMERVTSAYQAFPWQGGYSAVNFYNQLKRITPKEERPEIASISYASPGWIEIALILSVALNVEKIVRSVCASIQSVNKTYSDIMRGMQDRKLLKIEIERSELELKKEELEYVEAAAKEMAAVLEIHNLAVINNRTGHPYRTLKILLSLYRRVRILADYQREKKADFSNTK